MTGNLPMGTHKITGLTDGTAATDAASLGQVQGQAAQWATVGGTADAITLTVIPAITSYVAGQTFKFKATGTNTTATTVAVSGLTTKAVQINAAALVGGEIVSGSTYIVVYDGTAFQLFLSPPAASTTRPGSVELATIAETITGTDATRAVTPDGLAGMWENNSTDITDGAAITIGDGGVFNLITSTTAITSFVFTTSKAGRRVLCRFNTARTLTYNATSLIVPGAANITTAQGDICEVEDRGSGNVRVNWYTKADGTGVVRAVGSAVQEVSIVTGTMSTGTNAIPYDNTKPDQSATEGDEYMTLAITPTSATNKLKIDVVVNGAFANATARVIAALFQDSTALALAAAAMELSATGHTGNVKFTHWMTAGTTSSTTFKVRAGGSVGGSTFTFNGSAGAQLFGGVMASSITITEFKV